MKGYPEFHVGESDGLFTNEYLELSVYRDSEQNRFEEYLGGDKINRTSWHSDVVSLDSNTLWQSLTGKFPVV